MWVCTNFAYRKGNFAQGGKLFKVGDIQKCLCMHHWCLCKTPNYDEMLFCLFLDTTDSSMENTTQFSDLLIKYGRYMPHHLLIRFTDVMVSV